MKNYTLIPSHKIFWMLLIVVFLLLLMSFVPPWHEIIYSRVDLDGEATIPSAFSTMLLFSVSLFSFLIYRLGKTYEDDTSWKYFWLIFGAVYCFLSLDEAACLHEIFDEARIIKWIYVYAPVFGIFFIVSAYFFININKNKSLIYWVVGGMIVYALGGLVAEAYDYFVGSSRAEEMIEEALEMIGAIMVLRGCLDEFNRRLLIFGQLKMK